MYTFFKWMFSLFLIFIGVALVLRNLDIISLEIFDEIWECLATTRRIIRADFLHTLISGS